MKKHILLIAGMFLISCKEKDLIIYSHINKKDSTLILKIENTTDTDFLIEIPKLDYFIYKDEERMINPEYIGGIHYIKMKRDEDDIDQYLNLNLNCFDKSIPNIYPKFIDAKKSKNYYYKLYDYKRGRKINFKEDDINVYIKNMEIINDTIGLEKFSKIKTKKYGKYEYFTGSFEFIPKEITLP